MKILLLAGEESGLIYARQLAARFAHDEVRGYADYGFETGDLAVIGFWAVVKRLGYFLRVRRTMRRAIDEWRPDVLCTIDYPGMNLKLAAYAKKRGVRTVHVVCPQVWAWHQGRIPAIERALDKLCCFFPFEPRLFHPGFAEFVGHPLVHEFAGLVRHASGSRTLAMLPGSRIGEIEKILPTLIDAAAQLAADAPLRAVIPAANPRALAAIERLVGAARRSGNLPPGLTLEIMGAGTARRVLLNADCAVVASGTATLEAALARCPTVLVYRVSPLFAWLARKMITGTKYIGLANIIWDRCRSESVAATPPMPELIQEDFTAERVVVQLRPWLADPAARAAVTAQLEATVRLLTAGDAVERIAAACQAGILV